MCVIIYKPAHQPMPDEATLRECFVQNPDGAGYMFPTNNGIAVRKGYMTANSLIDSLVNVPHPNDAPLIIHMRIATQGEISQGNTHPFPVSPDSTKLTAKKSLASAALVHNGQLGMNYTGGTPHTLTGPSDTLLWTRDVLTAIRNPDALLRYAAKTTNSRFAHLFMEAGKWRLRTYGVWHKVGELYFSNLVWNTNGVKHYCANSGARHSKNNFAAKDTPCASCLELTYPWAECTVCNLNLCTMCYFGAKHNSSCTKHRPSTTTNVTNLSDTRPLALISTSAASGT